MSLSGIHEKILLKQQRDYKSDTKDAPKKKKKNQIPNTAN